MTRGLQQFGRLLMLGYIVKRNVEEVYSR